MPEIIVILLKLLIPFLVIFQIIPLLVWVERKGSAYIQDRPGPNRARIKGVRLGGLIHSLADVVKMMFKEDITPSSVNKPFYFAAPAVALFVACVTFVVIPFAAPIGDFHFQAARIDAGILYVLAMTSLGVYGIMLAGWASNNKYALLGGLRSSAQMISYELSMGLAVMAVVMITGSLGIDRMIDSQSANVLQWNFVRQPLAAILFIIAAFAETNRAPFDLPESESELVAGYHVEYSSLKFAMFFMAEYANMIVASAMIVALFFGGWQVPFLSTEDLRLHAQPLLLGTLWVFSVISLIIGGVLVSRFRSKKYGDARDYEVLVFGVPGIFASIAAAVLALTLRHEVLSSQVQEIIAAVIQILTFLFKILFMCWIFVWVRWTLPRFRYDQLMRIGWKGMLPLAVLNVLLTAALMLWGAHS